MELEIMKSKIIIALTICLISCSEKVKYKKIDLGYLQLTSIPDSIFTKTEVTDLDLGIKGFVIYPPLSALTPLNTDSSLNHLTQLDERIGNLTNLRNLNLSGNRLTSLPKSIIKLTELEALNLAFNDGLGVSKEIHKLRKMVNLKVLNIIGTSNMRAIEIIKRVLEPRVKVIYSSEDLLEQWVEEDPTIFKSKMDSAVREINKKIKDKQ